MEEIIHGIAVQWSHSYNSATSEIPSALVDLTTTSFRIVYSRVIGCLKDTQLKYSRV